MKLPKNNDRLVVGVSGGADSVALLRILQETSRDPRRQLIVAHVNYGLRGKASEQDERFVRTLAKAFDLPCRVLRVTRRQRIKGLRGNSLQDWARNVRYSFFQRWVQKGRAWGVAVAHHLDDQAETVLDRLLRGAGPRGLTGLRGIQILPLGPEGRPLRVWRPLLSSSKDDLKAYLKAQNAGWREDASNDKTVYRRNRIRNRLLPILEGYNPRIRETLARTGEVLAADEEFLESLVSALDRRLGRLRSQTRHSWKTGPFLRMPLALKRRLVRFAAEGLEPAARGLSFERIEEAVKVLSRERSGPRDLGFGLRVLSKTGRAAIEKRKS